MKKYIAYFFIVIYLFSFTEVRQVLKLPVLVEHYISHKLRDHGTTFTDFFTMHYLEDHGIDGDYDQDMKLPFKKIDFSSISLVPSVAPKKIEFSFEHKCLNLENEHNFAYSESFYPSVLQKIWRPPKI